MEKQKHLDILLRIGKKLSTLRKEQSLTQSQLAKKAHIHRVRLSEIENGSSFSIVTLIDILKALDKTEYLAHLVKPANSMYDDVFDEMSSTVFSSLKDIKHQDKNDKRSNIKLPDHLIEKYGI